MGGVVAVTAERLCSDVEFQTGGQLQEVPQVMARPDA